MVINRDVADGMPPDPRVLVIDDDPGLASALAWTLGERGRVQVAGCVEEAKRFSGGAFDLIVLDLRLPDGNGLDSIEWFQSTPFVVVTGFATTAATVRAMQLGAVGVLEKPVDVDSLLPLIRSDRATGAVASSVSTRTARRPAMERVAGFIIQACTSESDLRTLREWARHVGVSRTSLNEQLRLAGVKAQHARDFARALRAVVRSLDEGCQPESLIESRDHRTLALFGERTGLNQLATGTRSVDRFLAVQTLLPSDHGLVEAVTRRLSEPR